jgi:hypothetical protein
VLAEVSHHKVFHAIWFTHQTFRIVPGLSVLIHIRDGCGNSPSFRMDLTLTVDSGDVKHEGHVNVPSGGGGQVATPFDHSSPAGRGRFSGDVSQKAAAIAK